MLGNGAGGGEPGRLRAGIDGHILPDGVGQVDNGHVEVPLPERFNDIFERKQKKTPLPANIAALREAVAAFAKE